MLKYTIVKKKIVIDLCDNGLLLLLLDIYVNDNLNICSCIMNGFRF